MIIQTSPRSVRLRSKVFATSTLHGNAVQTDPLVSVRSHPLAGAAVGAVVAAFAAVLSVVASVERLAGPSAPRGLLEYFRLIAPFPLAVFAACTVGGAALPLLRSRRTSVVFGFLVLTAFWGGQILAAGDASTALMFGPVAALIFAVPVGLFFRLWIRNVIRWLNVESPRTSSGAA